MSLTFGTFSLSDENFITERVVVRGFASRALNTARINRREGIKLIGTEFQEKEITVDGNVIAQSASQLQSLLDGLKIALQQEEADLTIDGARSYRATVSSLAIPDEHYNNSKAPYSITFVCSDPFARGSQVSAAIPVPSGQATVSGTITVSGTFFARPNVTYVPPAATGDTLIRRVDLRHTNTGQTTTISGFSGGPVGGLKYQNELVFNLDNFLGYEGSDELNTTGSYPRWQPGTNNFTLTASGRAFPGGTVRVTYEPRFL